MDQRMNASMNRCTRFERKLYTINFVEHLNGRHSITLKCIINQQIAGSELPLELRDARAF